MDTLPNRTDRNSSQEKRLPKLKHTISSFLIFSIYNHNIIGRFLFKNQEKITFLRKNRSKVNENFHFFDKNLRIFVEKLTFLG